jgi:uncharacterized protein (TIGR02996 family)
MLSVLRENAMHPEADALLDAIWDSPGDDTPRLVYADWLQEHGQEDYAQFIRLSIEVERSSNSPAERKRINSVRKPFWRRIVAVRHDAVRHIPIPMQNFVRGICDSVVVHGDTLLRTISTWWPVIRPRALTVYGMRGFGTHGPESDIITTIGERLTSLRLLRCLSRPVWSVPDAAERYYPSLKGSVFSALALSGLLPRLNSLEVTVAGADIPAISAFMESELARRLATFRAEFRVADTERIEEIVVAGKATPDDIPHAIKKFLTRHAPVQCAPCPPS